MCGIYGRWASPGSRLSTRSVEWGTTRLRHRGPDDEGYLLSDSRSGRCEPRAGADTHPRLGQRRLSPDDAEWADLALGFRRLAILDLSIAGHQPMSGAAGDAWIVFNGEIFNYRELRDELRALGHEFHSGTDTEVILAAWREWGPRSLDRFNGMWAFAIWTPAARTLFLARDRFGVKPLFYVADGSGFAFASEIKALVGAEGIPPVPDEGAVFRYLAADVLPSPTRGETFFAGVHAVPPGSWMQVTPDGIRRERWYAIPQEERDTPVSADTAVREYAELFEDAVRLRLRSDVPLGTCLSGGLDSSSIVGVMRGLLGPEGDLRSFSAVYDEAGPFNERQHIDTVVAAAHTRPTFVVPTAERLRADIRDLVFHQDEPFGSTSIFAQWCVMSSVRDQRVTVLLDGQGADESLAGYRPFDVQISDLLRAGAPGTALRALRETSAVAAVSPWRTAARALAWQLPDRASRGLRRRRLAAASELLAPDLAARHADSAVVVPARRDMQAHLRELVEELSLPHLLRYEDRNSMAFSIEARVPFVDYRLIEYSFGRGAPWRIRGGWTKWLLREAMRDRVPESIVWRRDKVGFETPERRWLREWLRHDADLFGPRARSGDFLNLARVRAAAHRWVADGSGDLRRIWRCMNVELWLRAWAD